MCPFWLWDSRKRGSHQIFPIYVLFRQPCPHKCRHLHRLPWRSLLHLLASYPASLLPGHLAEISPPLLSLTLLCTLFSPKYIHKLSSDLSWTSTLLLQILASIWVFYCWIKCNQTWKKLVIFSPKPRVPLNLHVCVYYTDFSASQACKPDIPPHLLPTPVSRQSPSDLFFLRLNTHSLLYEPPHQSRQEPEHIKV